MALHLKSVLLEENQASLIKVEALNVVFTSDVNTFVHSQIQSRHPVVKGQIDGSPEDWFRKEMPNDVDAQIELLAQEFFRLIIPTQQESRIMRNNTTGAVYILSKSVPGFQPLPLDQASKFINGTFTGLGQVLLCAMFLEEADLKNGNIGLNNVGVVIKIDGDWCFSEDRYQGKYQITPEAIASLPYLKDYSVFNWLDIIISDIHLNKSRIISHAISNAPQFRHEVNQAILKISVLPDLFINAFVEAYIPTETHQYIRLIISRREELKKSALKNPSFVKYLKTIDAQHDIQSIEVQMTEFKAQGNQKIVPSTLHQELHVKIEKTFAMLRMAAHKQ